VWLSTNTRASAEGSKFHGSPKEYFQNKRKYQSSRSVGNNRNFYVKRQHIYRNVNKMVVATCINTDVNL